MRTTFSQKEWKRSFTSRLVGAGPPPGSSGGSHRDRPPRSWRGALGKIPGVAVPDRAQAVARPDDGEPLAHERGEGFTHPALPKGLRHGLCQGRQLETLRFQANQQVDVVEVPGTGVVLRQVEEGLELLREDLLDRIGIDGDGPVLKQERVGVADGFRMDGVSRGEVELHWGGTIK